MQVDHIKNNDEELSTEINEAQVDHSKDNDGNSAQRSMG